MTNYGVKTPTLPMFHVAPVSEYVTLRDQFAMAALPALIADSDSVAYPIGHAKMAYEYADAMLAAREEKK